MPQNPLDGPLSEGPPNDDPPERPTPQWHARRGGVRPDTPAWTASQLVSYNLLRARRAKGWTQQEFGEFLGRYTGRAWSNASVSAAERAWQGGRPRKFDVDEIHAFCAIFDVPIAYFLLPPEGDFLIVSPMGSDEEKAGKFMATAPIEYLKRILAVDPSADFLDRAQAAVTEQASLDFTPAMWDRRWEGGRRPDPETARLSHGRPGKVPAEETVEKAVDSRKRAEQLVEDLGLSDEDLDLVVKANAEAVAHAVALHLEKSGFLRVAEIEEEIRDLKERIRRLTDHRALE